MHVGRALNLHEEERGKSEDVLVSELVALELVSFAGTEAEISGEEAVEVLNGVLVGSFESDIDGLLTGALDVGTVDVHGVSKVDNRSNVRELHQAVVNVVDNSALVVEEHVEEPGGHAGTVENVDGVDGTGPGSKFLGGESPILVEGGDILVAVRVLVVGPNFVVVLEVVVT